MCKRIEIYDADVPELMVRVTSTGSKSFLLYTRNPGSISPSRRLVGKVGKISVRDAREKALGRYKLIDRDIDPEVEEERLRRDALLKLGM